MTTNSTTLSKRLYNGQSAAFAELYDLVEEKLFRYIHSQVRSSEDASDIIQNAFVQLVKSHKRLGKADNMIAYTFTVARNEMIRFLKLKKRFDVDSSLSANEPSAFDAAALESGEWISSVLSRLEPIDQEIVQLKIYSKLTFAEIAKITTLQQANVATRYRRSILKLESHLAVESTASKKQSHE